MTEGEHAEFRGGLSLAERRHVIWEGAALSGKGDGEKMGGPELRSGIEKRRVLCYNGSMETKRAALSQGGRRRKGSIRHGRNLYLVPTPIGNLGGHLPADGGYFGAGGLHCRRRHPGDSEAPQPSGVEEALVTYHRHNTAASGQAVPDRLLAGAELPGHGRDAATLTRGGDEALCAAAGGPGGTIPGPCALVTARWQPPASPPAASPLRELLANEEKPPGPPESLRGGAGPLIFYEAPHKLAATLRGEIRTLGQAADGMGRGLPRGACPGSSEGAQWRRRREGTALWRVTP